MISIRQAIIGGDAVVIGLGVLARDDP